MDHFPLLRSSSVCPHFGLCGGCTLQHLSVKEYKEYKVQKVFTALEKFSLEKKEILIHPLVQVSPGTRRRAVLKFCKEKRNVSLGFYRQKSHDLIDIQTCFVMTEALEALLKPLKNFLKVFLNSSCTGDIFITELKYGLDVLIKRPFFSPLSLDQREKGVQFAQDSGLVRFTIEGEVLYNRLPAEVYFANYPVEVHPTGFLQASYFSDEWLAQTVLAHLPASLQKVADLFCGYGTLTLPLSKIAFVQGYDTSEFALNSLQKTINLYQLPIQVKYRNLFRDPLASQELSKFQAVVLNPPREGAMSQCKALGQSKAARIIMVSCNPLTFARDAQILSQSQYRLVHLYLFDQFLWSEHIEVVGIFELK